MLKWLSRLVLAAWLVGMVALAVRGVPAFGESGAGTPKQYFPAVVRTAPITTGVLDGYLGVGVGGSGDIYTIRADGSELTNLTAEQEGEFQSPHFSPDGRRIAYVQERANQFQVGLMNADGGNPTVIMPYTFLDVPHLAWSPNGLELLVWGRGATVPERADLFRVSLVDGTTVPVAEGNVHEFEWGWSPDGRYVHYQQGIELWVTRTTSAEAIQISSQVVQVEWHPTRPELFLWEYNGTAFSGRIVAADGTVSTPLFTGDYRFQGWVMGHDHLLLWSPDRTPYLYTVPRTGGPLTAVFPDTTVSLHVQSVAPDGSAFIYRFEGENIPYTNIYTFASNKVESFWVGEGSITSMDWAADQSGVMFVTALTRDRETFSYGYYRSFDANGGQLYPLFGGYPYYSRWRVAYLPLSPRYAVAQWVDGYPPPHRQEYQLRLDALDSSDPSVPFAPEVPFIDEWRYLPQEKGETVSLFLLLM